MTITKDACRLEGFSEEKIASMDAMGFFEPTDPIEERRDDLNSEIEEVTDEIQGWENEVAELLESISKGKVRLALLRQQLSELPPAAEDDDE